MSPEKVYHVKFALLFVIMAFFNQRCNSKVKWCLHIKQAMDGLIVQAGERWRCNLEGKSVLVCAHHCQQDSGCYSYIFNSLTSVCKGLSVDGSNGQNVHFEDGDAYYTLRCRVRDRAPECSDANVYNSTGRLAETIPLVSGTFVCPQDGTYMFRASGLAETGKELKIKLYKDNKCIAAVFANDSNVVGNVAIIRMNSGDRLYVQVKQDGQCVVETSNEEDQFYSTLTYAMIAAGLETSFDSGTSLPFLMVGLNEDSSFLADSNVVFNTLLAGDSDMYNFQSGKMLVHEAGIYLVNYITVTQIGKRSWQYLYINGGFLCAVDTSTKDRHQNEGNTVITYMNAGDVITANNRADSFIHGTDNFPLATLSTVMIAPKADLEGMVAFSLALSSHPTVLAKTKVKYDRILYATEASYDTATGDFTAPKTGLYEFIIHALGKSGSTLSLELFANDEYLVSIYSDTSVPYPYGTNSVVVQLELGDIVYVMAHPDYNNSLYGNSYGTFSGFLVKAGVESGVAAVPGCPEVKYYQAMTNYSDTFKLRSGTFACQETGAYLINIHAFAEEGAKMNVKLYRNSESTISLFGYDDSVVGNAVILHLVEGDELHVQIEINGQCLTGFPFETQTIYSVFTYSYLGGYGWDFSVGFSEIASVNNTDKARFDTSIINSFSMYDISTGIVTVEVSGVYLVNVYCLAQIGCDCWFRIYKEGNSVATLRGINRLQLPNAGMSVIFHLNAGDETWIQSQYTSCIYSDDDEQIFTTFSGTLLASDIDINNAEDFVAFSVTMYTYQWITGGTNVVFDHVLFDSHDAYNEVTGEFTAPQAGRYHFILNAFADEIGIPLRFHIYKNNEYQVTAYSYRADSYAYGGTAVSLQLYIGDKVYLVVHEGHDFKIAGASYSAFSGFLIQPGEFVGR